ncbi:hypothetical protein KSF_106360 [Reticulibacter mediterranei]|uniref:Uncharacterized protein n=1 Tax=Reticulibacter mediterranei TaxID=2778369 RepID=A0A8J3IY27_9CHLR|nr:hypothetical protein [Reticulibacter mediterranei]GHP00589.1 hypothetical protein KSF_106360 [Reticulibacter mediterranei]
MGDQIEVLIATPLYHQATSFLREHSCVVQTTAPDGYLMVSVMFPQGTKQEKTSNSAAGVEEYRLTMPDDIVVIQTYDPATGWSTLLLPAQEDWKED